MTAAIEIKDLKKTYKNKVEALKGISLTVKKGSFYGILGPNGAGKSTAIGICCSLINKTAGSVKIMGYDIIEKPDYAKQFIGVVPQEFNFNIFEKVYQVILNQAGYYGVPRKKARERCNQLLKELGLWEKRNHPTIQLSGGMKRRLMIARALVHDPEILILDEPTAGVDINLRRSMWTFLTEQNKQGLTIILTTHYLEEAESLCERIAIIDRGQLIEDDKTDVLLEKLHSETFILYCDQIPEDITMPEYRFKKLSETTLEVELVKDQSLSVLFKHLEKKKIKVNRSRNKVNRLEELFVKLVENGDA